MLTVDRKALTRALKIVQPAVAKAASMPALFGVRLLATTEGLTLTASNLDLSIGTVIDADGDDLDVVANAATLRRIVGAGRESTIHLDVEDGHRLVLSSGASSSMPLIPDAFPNVTTLGDEVTEAKLTAEDMEQIARVLHAVSLDPQRVRLSGVHLAGCYAEATDSYRLARTTLSVELPDLLVQPSVLRSVIDHAVAPVGVASDGKRVQFTSGPTSWITSLIPQSDEAFPDIDRLLDWIKAKASAECAVSVPDLVDLLDRVRSLGPVSAASPAELNVEGSTLVASREIGGVGSIADDITVDGEMSTLRVNPSLLIDAIEHARADEVTLRKGEPGRPVLIEVDGYTAVVMPVAGTAK